MGEPLITTELENALLRMSYELSGYSPTAEWDEQEMRPRRDDVLAEEKELTRRHARRLLDVLYDVNREFLHIELGLV